MIVIKLGGSLVKQQTIVKTLNKVAEKYPGRAVIVPGGGDFADLVRHSQEQWRFDDKVAHEMAILAMQQMALLLNSLQSGLEIANSIDAIQSHIQNNRNVIWSPDIEQLNRANIASSWDISSDALAAWLAKQVNAQELILIKSVNIPADVDFKELAQQNIVDKAFNSYLHNAEFKTSIINQNDF